MKTPRTLKFERTKSGTIVWPSVEIEASPEIATLCREVTRACKAWRADNQPWRADPALHRFHPANTHAYGDALRAIRWPVHQFVVPTTFWVDERGENRRDSWFEGGQFVSSNRFHWFVDGLRFSYDYGRQDFRHGE